MQKIKDKIVIIGDTEASEAAKVLIDALNQLIERQNKVAAILKGLAKTAPLTVEVMDAIAELE